MAFTPADEIRSREGLAVFIHELHQEFVRRGDTWENPNLDRFLEALAAWVTSSDGWYRNFDEEMPSHGDWTFFARALAAAAMYE